LVNTISKLFTKCLSYRLTKWADDNALIDEAQGGFRRCYSTVDMYLHCKHRCRNTLPKRRGRLYVFYIDFLKAFDSCIHTNLRESLERKGIHSDSKFLVMFKSMYSNLNYCAKIKNGVTKSFQCEKGTKQGCVSSTIICSVTFMFADDVARLVDTVINLQTHIDYTGDYCKATGMNINVEQFKVMVVIFRYQKNFGYFNHIELFKQKRTEILLHLNYYSFS